MKAKRKYTTLTHAEAVSLVREFHFGGRTQRELADKYGVATGYVCRLCHGESRPDVYSEVAASKRK